MIFELCVREAKALECLGAKLLITKAFFWRDLRRGAQARSRRTRRNFSFLQVCIANQIDKEIRAFSLNQMFHM